MQLASQQTGLASADLTSPDQRQAGYTNFEYTGKTALNVTGNFTGINYRFNRPGDVQPVNYRDAPALMGITVLKRLG